MHDAADQRALDARDELAIAERARPALAVADVAVAVKRAVAPEAADLAHAGLRALAALEQNRFDAVLQKGPGGEQARRPGADDERRLARPFDFGKRLKRARHVFTLQINFDRILPKELPPVARVKAALQNADLRNVFGGDSQMLCHEGFEIGIFLVRNAERLDEFHK